MIRRSYYTVCFHFWCTPECCCFSSHQVVEEKEEEQEQEKEEYCAENKNGFPEIFTKLSA